MTPARLLPAALLLFMLWLGGAVSWSAADYVGWVWAITWYWAYLMILAVVFLNLGSYIPKRLRDWLRRQNDA